MKQVEKLQVEKLQVSSSKMLASPQRSCSNQDGTSTVFGGSQMKPFQACGGTGPKKAHGAAGRTYMLLGNKFGKIFYDQSTDSKLFFRTTCIMFLLLFTCILRMKNGTSNPEAG